MGRLLKVILLILILGAEAFASHSPEHPASGDLGAKCQAAPPGRSFGPDLLTPANQKVPPKAGNDILILTFWSASCIACMDMGHYMNGMLEKKKNNPNVRGFAWFKSEDETQYTFESYLKRFVKQAQALPQILQGVSITQPIRFGMKYDRDGSLFMKYKIREYPLTFILKNGEIKFACEGYPYYAHDGNGKVVDPPKSASDEEALAKFNSEFQSALTKVEGYPHTATGTVESQNPKFSRKATRTESDETPNGSGGSQSSQGISPF